MDGWIPTNPLLNEYVCTTWKTGNCRITAEWVRWPQSCQWVGSEWWVWPWLRVQGEVLTLELFWQKPAATVTLCLCLVNSACAILSVVPSTHFVSCTMQCEETGSHFLSRSGRLQTFTQKCERSFCDDRRRSEGCGGIGKSFKYSKTLTHSYPNNLSFVFFFFRVPLFSLSHTLIKLNLLALKLWALERIPNARIECVCFHKYNLSKVRKEKWTVTHLYVWKTFL